MRGKPKNPKNDQEPSTVQLHDQKLEQAQYLLQKVIQQRRQKEERERE